MSGRDDQPVTIPPPAGEDDAYNAATKVGAMPAEVMAKLRAEGLLPDEPPERPPPTYRSGAPRPSAAPRILPAAGALPDVSDADDTDERTVLANSSRLAALPLVPLVPSPAETPVAFSSTPPAWPPPQHLAPAFPRASGPPPAAYPVHPSFLPLPLPPPDPAGVTQEVRAFGGKRSRTLTVLIVVGVLFSLVGAVFIMALLSHRR